jgi:excisionase family DNA binding protein
MRKSATNEDVLSTREAAERLGVALRTVQLWVESGVLPAWKTAGGHRRISRTAVERLIEERRNALAGDERSEPVDPNALFKVMVVEDEPQLLQLLIMVIKGWELPLEVSGARDGFDALLQMGRSCPDLLITDLNMPGMDGFKMIASLRAQGAAFGAMDIVVVTALTEAEIAQRGGLPDGVRVFHKPVPYDHIEQLVRDRLGGLAAAA